LGDPLSDGSAWVALAGALGGVAVTGSLSLATAALTRRWGEQSRVRADREQETRAMRDQEREACHNYLVATNSFYQAVDQVYRRTGRNEQFDQREHARAAITALQDTYVYLTISAGADVRKLARDYNVALYELEKAAQHADHGEWPELERETHRARRELREAMRTELGVQDLLIAIQYAERTPSPNGRGKPTVGCRTDRARPVESGYTSVETARIGRSARISTTRRAIPVSENNRRYGMRGLS
jgi:hypothetical protein